MSCLVAGCDPGRSGAICLLYADGGVVIHDMPCRNDHNGKVDGVALYNLFDTEAPGLVVIEDLHGPNYYKIGHASGTLECAAELYEARAALCVAAVSSRCHQILRVAPQTWQAAMLDQLADEDTKDASIRVASELLADPAMLKPTPRSKPKDDRADAVCIAHYGVRYLTENGVP